MSSVVDHETQEKIDVVKQRLIKNFGYNEVSATDVLNFVASIFARGDVKLMNTPPPGQKGRPSKQNPRGKRWARLCVELETDDATGVMSRALGLLEMVQRTKRQGGRLCFVNERGDAADVVF